MNPIWKAIPGWEKDISNISWGDIEDNNEALRKLAEFTYLLAEEVGRLRELVNSLTGERI